VVKKIKKQVKKKATEQPIQFQRALEDIESVPLKVKEIAMILETINKTAFAGTIAEDVVNLKVKLNSALMPKEKRDEPKDK
jgi:hypothetical protein